ncbi:MAG TPA: FHA domain-containing protein [Pirellulales bacterium]|nr:FHA domain-containing protein [Pirellulales bacterium]
MFTDKSRSSHADLVLQRQLTLIGRQTPATWRIKHPTISRAHGAVVWDGDDLWLIDFFSSNGTRLGENRCDASLVRMGQEFRVGTVTCCYLDVQTAAGGSTGDQGVGGAEFSDSCSTRRAPVVEGQADDLARERRVDAPQPQDEIIAPPHGTGGDAGRIVPGARPELPPVPPSEWPSSGALAPAVLVETRPLTGDTKFVDRPVRSQEDRLAAVEVELAAQREVAAARAARIDSELFSLRQELERLEAALRQQRELDRDHRAQVAELRERVLRELAQIGEQTQLVRQAGDARPWEGALARLADDTVRRCAELDRQVREGLQSASRELASVEGTMIAKMAELRSRQARLAEERPSTAADDSESVLAVEPLRDDWAEDDHPAETRSPAGSGPVDDAAGAVEWPSTQQARVGSKQPVTDRPGGSAPWRLGEAFTHRLVDFQTKRERSAWQRRLLWTGAAVITAVVIVVVAGLLRSWLNADRADESSAAPSMPPAKSEAAEKDAG